MPPTVTEAAQVGRPSTLVGPERDWNLHYPGAEPRRLDGELRRKFHAGRAQFQAIIKILCKTTHAAVHVPNSGAKKQVQHRRHHRCAEVSVMPRHRSRFDDTPQSVTHYEFISSPPARHEFWHLGKVVAIVGIAHNDKLADRSLNSGS